VSSPHELPAPTPLIAPHSATLGGHPRRTVPGRSLPRCDQWFWPTDAVVLPPLRWSGQPARSGRHGTHLLYTIVRVSGAIGLGGEAYKTRCRTCGLCGADRGPHHADHIGASTRRCHHRSPGPRGVLPYRRSEDQRYPVPAGVTVE